MSGAKVGAKIAPATASSTPTTAICKPRRVIQPLSRSLLASAFARLRRDKPIRIRLRLYVGWARSAAQPVAPSVIQPLHATLCRLFSVRLCSSAISGVILSPRSRLPLRASRAWQSARSTGSTAAVVAAAAAPTTHPHAAERRRRRRARRAGTGREAVSGPWARGRAKTRVSAARGATSRQRSYQTDLLLRGDALTRMSAGCVS
jgi:hypothetical protein